jgi:CheY-like chemotaxis protein
MAEKAEKSSARKSNGAKDSPAPTSSDFSIAAILESAKTATFLGFALLGIAFIVMNWSKLTAMLNQVSRFEGFGIKVELTNRSYADFIVKTRGELEQGYLSEEQHRAAQLRANWILPLLSSATVLWVDDKPELVNNEMQFLTSYRVSIRIARNTEQAIEEVKAHRFDLVISDVSRTGEKNGPLTECPVHWFEPPQNYRDWNLNEPVEFNKRYNREPDAGFYLVERLRKEVADEDRPPVILYTGFRQPVVSACGSTITTQTYRLIMTVFDLIEQRRWQELEAFTPPWVSKPAARNEKDAK